MITQKDKNKLEKAKYKYIGNLILQDYEHKKQSLNSFIKNFLIKYNNTYTTLYPNNKTQCYTQKSRSLGDIFMICQTYYPDCTLLKVKNILLSFENNLVGHFCGDINRRVYEHKDNKSHWGQCGMLEKDEFDELITYNN